MSEVEFSEEEAYKAEIDKRAVLNEKIASVSPLLNLPLKLGLAKDTAGATFILAGVAIIAALAALLIFLFAP